MIFKRFMRDLICVLLGLLAAFVFFQMRYERELEAFRKEQRENTRVFVSEFTRCQSYEDQIQTINWFIQRQEYDRNLIENWNKGVIVQEEKEVGEKASEEISK